MIRHAISRGAIPTRAAEYLHLRAKDLPVKELLRLARELRQSFHGKLLINERIDVCLAVGAHGVHLPSQRIAPQRIKERFGKELIVGVSCHSVAEVERAAQEGANYVFLSPIFPTLSKPGYGPPLGLKVLQEAAARVTIPVIALGGIQPDNEGSCLEAGAKGIAGISYFFPMSGMRD